ncbi:MAG: MFS transporter [Pseudomonadota bacterium]
MSTYPTLSKRQVWTIWGAATSFYFLRVILFIALGVFGAKIQTAFSISAGRFGSLAGGAYVVYGILQLPLALLMDRIGPRIVLTVSCSACVCGSLAFALATNMYWAELGSLLIGGGAAIAYVGAMSVTRRLFLATDFAFVVGLIVLVGSAGGAGMQELFAVLTRWESWRTIVMALAGLGTLILGLLWLIIPPEVSRKESGTPPARPRNLLSWCKDLKGVVSHRQIWLAGIYRGLTLGQMLSFGYVWDIPFQMTRYNDLSKSVAINCAVLIGFGLGSATVGRISDRIRSRLLPMRITAVVMMFLMGCLIWFPGANAWVEACLLFGFGFSCGGASLGHALGAESSPKYLTATALGFVSTIAYLIAGGLQILPGIFLDMTPTPHPLAGMVCRHTVGQYCDSFIIFPIASICALAATVGLRENFPERSPEARRSNDTASARNTGGCETDTCGNGPD